MPCRVNHRKASARRACSECRADAGTARTTGGAAARPQVNSYETTLDAAFVEDEEIVVRCLSSNNPRVRAAAASNPIAPLEELKALEDREIDPDVVESIAQSPAADDALLMKISERGYKYDYFVFRNPSLSVEKMKEILSDRVGQNRHRRLVYGNKSLPPEVRDKYARLEWDGDVHDAIIGSSQTTMDTVAYIVSTTASGRAFQAAAKRKDIDDEVAEIVVRRARSKETKQLLLFNKGAHKCDKAMSMLRQESDPATALMATNICVQNIRERFGLSEDAAETLLVHDWWELDDDSPEVFIAKTMHQKMES